MLHSGAGLGKDGQRPSAGPDGGQGLAGLAQPQGAERLVLPTMLHAVFLFHQRASELAPGGTAALL